MESHGDDQKKSPPRTPVAAYLSVRGGAEAIDFYKRAFAAQEAERYEHEGTIGHAALRVNGSAIYLADEYDEAQTGVVSPAELGGRTTVVLNLNVSDADEWYERAVAAGCETLRAPSDQFYGRHASVRDPFGPIWSFVKHKDS